MTVAEFGEWWQMHKAGKDSRLLYLKDWHFANEFPNYKAYTTPCYFQEDWLNDFYDMKQAAEKMQQTGAMPAAVPTADCTNIEPAAAPTAIEPAAVRVSEAGRETSSATAGTYLCHMAFLKTLLRISICIITHCLILPSNDTRN